MQERIFVGRERELETLREYLEKALAGTGQVSFISGQAGSGKTALVRRFVEQAFAANPDVVLAMGSCNAQTGIGDPFLPFREALTMLTGDASTRQAASQIAPENSRRLQTVLVRSVQVLVEVAPELVGVFIPAGKLLGAVGKAIAVKAGWMDRLERLTKQKALAAGLGLTQAEQGRIFEQYTAFVQRLSAKTPLILFLDDLQWADTASLNLLFHLGRHLDKSRALMLGAYRPNDIALGRDGERHPLEPVVNELTRYYGDVTVDLDGLPETVNRHFVDALLDTEPNALGEPFRQALFHQTGGHALFTVELIRDMQERGDLVRDGGGRWLAGPTLNWSALPARVEGVIEERIDRLDGELRELLNVASVEGEEFSAEVVARVEARAEREVIRQLSGELGRQHRLVNAQGLARFGLVRLSQYRFVHNLFQQYLYNNLGEAERAYLHRDVGGALETLFDGQTEEVAAQLARHLDEGGLPGKAATYRLQAGNRARRMSAHREALKHLTRGLELLDQLPPGRERLQLELDLQISLGTVLFATEGYASPKVDRAFSCARELCRALGDPPQTMQTLLGQLVFYLMRGELDRAHQEGEQALILAQQVGDVGYQMACHLLLGAAAMYMASYDRARKHLERVAALYDPAQHQDLAYILGQDPGVEAPSFLSRVLWLQGYPEQALARQDVALELAEALDHPYTSSLVSLHAATMRQLLRQWPDCQAWAERALRRAKEGHFTLWQANGTILHGLALAHQGAVEEGIAQVSQGLFLWEATGAALTCYPRACLAEAYLLAGRREEGLRAVDESLYRGGQGWWLPEQYRLRAQLLLLAPGAEVEAEALLRQALDVARSQRAPSLELRAAMSLARLLDKQGRTGEGRASLVECYDSFTEGLETADLREARELLAELERHT